MMAAAVGRRLIVAGRLTVAGGVAGAVEDLVQFTAVQPHATTLRAVVDLDAIALRQCQRAPINRAIHDSHIHPFISRRPPSDRVGAVGGCADQVLLMERATNEGAGQWPRVLVASAVNTTSTAPATASRAASAVLPGETDGGAITSHTELQETWVSEVVVADTGAECATTWSTATSTNTSAATTPRRRWRRTSPAESVIALAR